MKFKTHKRLPIMQAPAPEPGVAERHPNDGWELADPIPLPRATERVLRGLVRAILPPAPAPRSEELDERVTQHVRRMINYTPVGVGLGILGVMHVLDLSPLWRGKALHRLQNLEPDRASDVLKDMEHSRWTIVRLMLLAPKALSLSTYFDQAEVHEAMNYEPRGFIRDRIARRKELVRQESAAVAKPSPPVNTVTQEVSA